MGDLVFPEAEEIRATNRNIWVLITTVFTFISGTYASRGDWISFAAMLTLWAFTGFLLAVCRPGQRRSRQL